MNQNKNQAIKYIVLLILVLGTIIGLTLVNFQFSSQNPGGNDFLARWNGAHEWLINGNNPYSNQVSEVAQRMIYGRLADASKGEDIAHFVYPIYSMIFFAPFALMDYTLARAVWMTVLELALIALTVVSIRIDRMEIEAGDPGRDPVIFIALVLFHPDDHTGSILGNQCLIDVDHPALHQK